MNDTHLLLVMHGMLALKRDMLHLIQRFQPCTVIVVDTAQGYTSTTSGIQEAGRAVLRFVQHITDRESYTKISLLGHSLGGLVLRWALGNGLLDHFVNGRPHAYFSSVSPHLGIRESVHSVMSLPFGETGRQLMLKDTIGLLFHMAEPAYTDVLRRFSYRVCFGIAETEDMRVHRASAMIRPLYYDKEDMEYDMAMKLAVLGWQRIALYYPPELLGFWRAHSDVKFDERLVEAVRAILSMPGL